MLGFDLDEFALNLGFFLDDIPDGEVVGRSGRAGGSPTEHIGRGGGAGIYNTGIAVRSLLTGPLVQNKYYSNNRTNTTATTEQILQQQQCRVLCQSRFTYND